MTKYKQYFNKMLADNKQVFADFRTLHDSYALAEDKWQDKFNEEGEKVLEIVREYENRLCANTERGIYNKFSSNLAEKFQAEVRKNFPMIDHVGVKVNQPQPTADSNFNIRKINLL